MLHRVGLFVALLALGLGGCAKPKPPQPPGPSPTPLPAMNVLRIEGARFIPAIYGAAAGSGSIPYGWPDASIEFLDALKANGLNYVHTRTGPFVREGEASSFDGYVLAADGHYDLEKFNPAYDQKERDFLAAAQARGIYVERVLLDDWPPKYGLWPYFGGRNLQHIAYDATVFQLKVPPPTIETWVRHRVANTCSFPNVFYALDNEPRPVNTSAEWTRYFYAAVKDEMRKRSCSDRPVGSGNRDAWDTVDYQIIHTFRVPAPSLKPVMVNETDNRETTPEQYIKRAYRGREVGGIYFQFWPGPMEERAAQVSETLALYGQFLRTAAIDYECPAFKGFTRPNIQLVQGGKYTFNVSPIPQSEGADPFSSQGDGLCEDIWINDRSPQRYQDGYGPTWRISGGGTIEPNWQNPYLAFVWNPAPGSTRVQVCGRADTNCSPEFAFP